MDGVTKYTTLLKRRCITHQNSTLFYTLIHDHSFLQLDDIGGQHDHHLRIIGGGRKTLEGYTTHMLQSKG